MNKIKITTYTFLLCAAVWLSGCEQGSGTKMYLEAKTQNSQEVQTVQDDGNMVQDGRSSGHQTDGTGKDKNGKSAGETGDTCFVYVCGAVKHPGVFELPLGSRVYEAVALAGGFCKNAYEKGINQAAQIEDGQMIEVLTIKEQKESGQQSREQDADGTETQKQDGRIDINTASAEQLMTLSGIGEAKAANIIAYRESSGSFSSTEDLMNVTGIGEGVYARIKDKVKVAK